MSEKDNGFELHTHEKAIPPGIIVSQGEERFHHIKYGLFPMSFNGCEIISVYNSFVLLGKKPPELDELIRIFKRAHLCLLLGWWGSNVYKTHKAIRASGLECEKVRPEDIKNDGIYVVSFWNRKPPLNGIHTVALEIKAGKTTVYNLYSNRPISNKTVAEFAGKRFIRGYKIYDSQKAVQNR